MSAFARSACSSAPGSIICRPSASTSIPGNWARSRWRVLGGTATAIICGGARIARKRKPSNLDWAHFLGPLKWRDYDPQQYFNWRAYLDFGGGQVTDLFTHWIDVVHMFMGQDSPGSGSSRGRRLQLQGWAHGARHDQCATGISERVYRYVRSYARARASPAQRSRSAARKAAF